MTTEPNGIDMDVLLAAAARAQGLDPEQPSPSMGPTIAHLVTEIGPLIVHPLATGPDLRWLAAGLDALARAAEQAAHDTEPATTSGGSRLWRYDLRGDRVQINGALRAAEPDSSTIGVHADELPALVTLLGVVMGDPAYRAWWDRNTPTLRYWHLQTHARLVLAHSRTDKYSEFPEPGRWRLRGSINLHLSHLPHLHQVLTALTEVAPPASTAT